ncbi:hypothetical protein EVA_10916, partial [gut metagenome]
EDEPAVCSASPKPDARIKKPEGIPVQKPFV